jgi:hypothetical protein
MDEYVDLDVVGALEGSDKSSSARFAWDYLRHYEALLAPYRDQAINVLEIGIGKGPSLRMWRWFFSQAEITGVDINPDCLRHAGPRVTVEIGSQIDPAFLDRICNRAPPTVIIDDGSHVYEHMIFSFEHLFPKLAPGGIYIVEDIIFHTGPGAAPRAAQPNVPEYFLDLARRCFARGHVPAVHDLPGFAAEMVDRVAFLGHAVAIHKRTPLRNVARGVATAEAYLAEHPPGPEMELHYAEWLLAHDGPNDRAAAAVDAAMAGGLAHPQVRLLQAETLRRFGDAATAQAIADAVAEQNLANHHVLLALAALQLRLGDAAAALRTRNAAYAITPMSKDLRRRFELLLPQA